MKTIIESVAPDFLHKDKIYKSKDVIVNLKYFGSSFDKIKTNHPNRAKALVLGYKAWKLGINETQLRSLGNPIDDREIVKILEHKEKKHIRSWSTSTKVKEDEYKTNISRLWCKKLGAIALILGLSQKDLIEASQTKFKDALDCSIPKEF
ncbi:MAG: hypothetical protein PHW07_09015 [Sulfurospirillaceae bacterium]|nr:hypothetical protein [Sulfurospirillaceae bacterium]